MPVKVTKYMSDKVITVSPDLGVREAFFKMKEHRIRHLPVVNDNKELVGIISDRELRRPNWVDESHDIAHNYYLDDNLSVSDIMIKNVYILNTYDNLRKAIDILLEHNISAAPVIDKTGDLVGMLSAVDLLRALYDLLQD